MNIKKPESITGLPYANRKVYELIQEETNGDVRAFAKSINVSYQSLNCIFCIDKGSGKYPSISDDIKRGIIDAYDKDEIWFITDKGKPVIYGEGEILKSQHGRAELPVGEYREDEIPEKFMTCLVPMSAMGGSLVGFEESGVRREDCEKVVSPIADADWAVPVCGDSMEPEYPNGSRVFVKQINPGDFIQWGNVFVLDTTNGLIIKMVMQSDKKDCIKCVSLNPSGRYQPFDVPMRTVRAMYRVLLCVSIK